MPEKTTPITTHESANPADKPSSFLTRLQEHLTFLRQCPLCKAEYESQGLQVLYERGPIHLLHVTCSNCQNAVLALVSISDMGMSSLGLYTDLTADDLSRLSKDAPITEDDILQLSQVVRSKHPFVI